MGSLGIESIQEENGNDYIYSGKEKLYNCQFK